MCKVTEANILLDTTRIYSSCIKHTCTVSTCITYSKYRFAFSFVCAHRAQLFSPMTALAMVIFNHILSRISRPESGNCITLTMVAMSVLLADRGRSSNSGVGEEIVSGTSQLFKSCEVN